MGVDRTSYLIYGFKFVDKEEKEVINENWDDLMEDGPTAKIFNNNKSDQVIVYDYMCGEYVYIGVKLADLDEYDDDISVEISEAEINELKNKLNEYMKAWPDYVQKLCDGKTPKMYFFIHAY